MDLATAWHQAKGVPPLEDPRYPPRYKPVNGSPPSIVARWGPRSQVRWFDRFHRELEPMPVRDWDRFYPTSTTHRGLCCQSCSDDVVAGYDPPDGCCCKALRDQLTV